MVSPVTQSFAEKSHKKCK